MIPDKFPVHDNPEKKKQVFIGGLLKEGSALHIGIQSVNSDDADDSMVVRDISEMRTALFAAIKAVENESTIADELSRLVDIKSLMEVMTGRIMPTIISAIIGDQVHNADIESIQKSISFSDNDAGDSRVIHWNAEPVAHITFTQAEGFKLEWYIMGNREVLN